MQKYPMKTIWTGSKIFLISPAKINLIHVYRINWFLILV